MNLGNKADYFLFTGDFQGHIGLSQPHVHLTYTTRQLIFYLTFLGREVLKFNVTQLLWKSLPRHKNRQT